MFAYLARHEIDWTLDVLSARPQDVASNEAFFRASRRGQEVCSLGAGVTLLPYRDRLRVNLIGQYQGRRQATMIQQALKLDLVRIMRPHSTEKRLIRMLVQKPSLYPLAALALIKKRLQGDWLDEQAQARINLVDAGEKRMYGPWRPQVLPSGIKPWTYQGEEDVETLKLAVCDEKISLWQRFMIVCEWLDTGKLPREYWERVVNERLELIQALDEKSLTLRISDGVAVVVSTLRAGPRLAYRVCPVMVCLNPAYHFTGGPAVRKYTVGQYGRGYADIPEVLRELNRAEPGWGGNELTGGSPQGENANLSLETVVRTMAKHRHRSLKERLWGRWVCKDRALV